MQKLLNVDDIAGLIGYTRASVHSLMSQIRHGRADPRKLPQPLAIPGRPRWTLESFEQWQRALTPAAPAQAAAAPGPRALGRTGRPRKAGPARVSLY